ncbi:MAG: AzlD domain-containing protein, partial [Candidatus Binatota bacterium]|nr:AzlD domain-containing protein [Candidatus Binatota bacterium]
ADVGDLLVLVLACAAGTYVWRALGVAVAGRLDPNGEWLSWMGCVALAMIAGLVARMLVEPVGVLTTTSLLERLGATACALVMYFGFTRRNLLAGVVTGCVAIVLLQLLR